MVQFNQLDLGQIMGNVQGIKSAQLQNQLGQQKLQANEMMMEREAQFNPLLQNYLANPSKENAQALFAADPQRGMQAVQQQQQFSKSQALETYTIARAVGNAKDPLSLLKNGYPGAFDEFSTELMNMGRDINKMSAEEIKQMAKSIEMEAGTMAGIDVQGQDLQRQQAEATLASTRASTQKTLFDMRQAGNKDLLALNNKQLDQITGLITDVKKDERVDNFIKTKTAYDRIESSGDTAAGDLSMIFAYMKMLDPGSTVREGEFATAQNAAGVPGRIRALYGRALDGTRLTPEQRKDFKDQAKGIFEKSKGTANEALKPYEGVADRFNLRKETLREAVFGVESAPTPQASGPHGPKVVQNGVTYVWDAASGKYKAQE